MKTRQRRTILCSLCGSGLAALLPKSALVRAQTAALQVDQVNEKTFVVRGPDANVLVIASSEGAILVDGGSSAWSSDLLSLVGRLTDGQPVRALINTHWHPEQVGANAVLGELGTEIIAHDNTRLWLGTEVRQRWSGEIYAALPEWARPNSTFIDSNGKQIGEHAMRLGYLLHAHTDGDIYVYLPEANVMFAGGFLTNDGWPLIDWWTGGWSGGMLNAFDMVLPVCNENTVIVPSSGPLMTYGELREQREMYLAIFDKVHTAFVKSLGPDEIVASGPAAGFKPQWGNADLFVKLAAQSLQGHLRGGVGSWLPRIP